MYAWIIRQHITRKDGSKMGRAVDMDTGNIEWFHWTKEIKNSVLESELQIATRDMDNKRRSFFLLQTYQKHYSHELEEN